MSIKALDRKKLWGRAGNQCAWPGCPVSLTADLTDPDSGQLGEHGAVIGEEAHIRSGRPDGPRYDAEFPDVDSFLNLILLCPTHHTIIDKDAAAWPVDRIEQIRKGHERRVHEAMNWVQQRAVVEGESVAARVDRWVDGFLAGWPYDTFQLCTGYPRIREASVHALADTAGWLLGLEWPDSYAKTSVALDRWRDVTSTLLDHIEETFEAEDGRPGQLRLSPSHKRIGRVDAREYASRAAVFAQQSVILRWLVYDLTRTGNLVVAAVRAEVDPMFRFQEGFVVVESDGWRELVTFEETDWDALPVVPSRQEILSAAKVAQQETGAPTLLDVDVRTLLY